MSDAQNLKDTAPAGARRKRMQMFRGDCPPQLERDHLTVEGMDENVIAGFAKLQGCGAVAGLAEQTTRLFAEDDENGLSLVKVWFKSGNNLPRHSHSSDCLYYIIGGEARMGATTLKKGDGVFIPADQAYTLEAGPDGVELLEFRNATRYNIFYKGNDEAHWERIAEGYRTRGDIWRSELVPPSER